MRSKAPLAMMEQLIMVLVFALASALCLRTFVWADSASRDSWARDRALLRSESAAEVLRHYQGDYQRSAQRFGGTWDGEAWTVYFDADWEQCAENGAYTLTVTPEENGQRYLGTAAAEVRKQNGKVLLTLPVSWQEEG